MLVLIIILSIIAIGLIYCYSETKRFKTTEYSINNSKIPIEAAGKSFLLISDAHCCKYGKNNIKLFNAIAKSKIDFIVIAGDLINGHSVEEFKYAEEFLYFLSGLNIPVIYSFGNHEIKFTRINNEIYMKYRDFVSDIPNITVLDNASADMFGMHITGLNLPYLSYYGKLSKASKLIKLEDYISTESSDKYHILVAHDPSFAEKYYSGPFDLILSGHQHGGIVRFPFVGGLISPRYRLFPEYDKGVFYKNNKTLLISGGVGSHTLPFRFNNIPELLKVTLDNSSN